MKIIKHLASLIILISLPLFAAETPENFSPIEKPAHVSTNAAGVAIDGYDPVAYFDKDKAVKGNADHSCEYNNVVWHFTSAENRDRFLEDPEKFSPQYGGYCAYSIANNKIIVSDPEAFTIRDDKLYLYRNEKLGIKDVKKSDIKFSKVKTKRDNNWLTYQQGF